MARKLQGFRRVLDAPALFSIAYGEVGSSIYLALGIVALHALGLTPAVLLAVGGVFLIVSLSYAEGTAAIDETGGAATFVRRAFNDLVGFMTGWVLFLDYLIVIVLSALFLPHYFGAALDTRMPFRDHRDVVVGVFVILGVATFRLFRHARLFRFAIVVALVDLVTQALLIALGLAFLFSGDALTRGLSVGSNPTWHSIAFALPLAMLAYTGLETVANFAEETREPGRTLPRSLFSAFGVVIVFYVAIALVGLSAFPGSSGSTDLGRAWVRAPLMGIVDALQGPLPGWAGTPVRLFVGFSGTLILLFAITTSISGFTRLAFSMGEHGQLPREFGRLNRRSFLAPQGIIAAALTSVALLISTAFLERPIAFLATLFSFGVAAAFTAAQLAVIRLRATEPGLERPFRVPFSVRIRGADVPIPAVIGALLTLGIWIAGLATHAGARYGGPAWLAVGLVVYGLVRRGRGEGLLERVEALPENVPEVEFSRILVPMKLGLIGEEMVATAVKLARDRGAEVDAVHVIRVPLDRPLEAELMDEEERATASLAEARLLGSDYGVEVRGETVRARSIGEAIVAQAKKRDADLIVLGSAPHWRRQSRFFSPTVEYVLRKAPCEVLVVAFPQGVLEEDGAGG